MIISRTPLRISFAGGITDIPEFYRRDFGAVTSTAIDKYVYVMVNPKFTGKTRIAYKHYEEVDTLDDISHPIIRESLRYLNIHERIEITTIADVPGGTGLGSSSSFTVGLLNALHRHLGQYMDPLALAEEACHIEIDVLGEPIGKQDQYIAAFGGLNHMTFRESGVEVKPISVPEEQLKKLENNLTLHFLKQTKNAGDLLSKQIEDFDKNYSELVKLRTIAQSMATFLEEDARKGTFTPFGELLHEAWLVKRIMRGVTNDVIDRIYTSARKKGAIGGKVCGAGGRGFLLLYSEASIQDVLNEMNTLGLQELKFKFEKKGSEILYDNENEKKH
jgi:D-glycero-alpha-D-manno-heptose-7-phosphate kinase